MLAFLVAVCADLPGQEVQRGRDPWVFRCIFEDRPRTLIVALGQGLWYSFNPVTCGTHKVWKGEIDFRGKVFDFSQDNSAPKGDILVQSDQYVFRLGKDGRLPQGWQNRGCTFKDGAWWFGERGSGRSLTSPPVDTRPYQTLYLAFDEISRKGRIEVYAIGQPGGESFQSMTSVDSDTNWQWNFKRIESRSPATSFHVQTTPDQQGKAVRDVRLFGDYYAWATKVNGWVEPCQVNFKGYQTDGTKSVTVRFSVSHKGKTADVTLRPELVTSAIGPSWNLAYDVKKPSDMDLFMVNPPPGKWDGLSTAPETLFGVPCARVRSTKVSITGNPTP